MANYCVVCERRRPPEPVRTLIVGQDWIEFCEECKDSTIILAHPDGVPISLIDAYNEAKALREK